MFSERHELRGAGTRFSLACGLMDHPVFKVMSSTVRSLVSAEARRLTLKPGEEGPEESLLFVMKGILGVYEAGTGLAVAAIGPGTLLGGQGVSSSEPASRARAICDCVIYVVPISILSQLGGATWIHRFLTAHVTSRARMLGSERLCANSHSEVERLAKWCLRLRHAQLSVHDELAPKTWASLVGLGEADLVRVWGQLAEQGAVAARPGEVQGFQAERLSHLACDCDLELDDGGVERRSRRRLIRRH